MQHLYNLKYSLTEGDPLSTYQERLTGLLAIGMPERLARVIAFRPELVGELGVAAQVAINPGMAVVPELAARAGNQDPKKRRRKTTKYQKALGKALVEQKSRQRKKNGQLKKAKTPGSILKAAHKMARKMSK